MGADRLIDSVFMPCSHSHGVLMKMTIAPKVKMSSLSTDCFMPKGVSGIITLVSKMKDFFGKSAGLRFLKFSEGMNRM